MLSTKKKWIEEKESPTFPAAATSDISSIKLNARIIHTWKPPGDRPNPSAEDESEENTTKKESVMMSKPFSSKSDGPENRFFLPIVRVSI